jgi:hypothetical protein
MGDLPRSLNALASDFFDHWTVVEQRIVESHGAADNGQQRIVAEQDRPSGAAQMNGDRRSDFMGAKDYGEW